jgi:hypothetical protein
MLSLLLSKLEKNTMKLERITVNYLELFQVDQMFLDLAFLD